MILLIYAHPQHDRSIANRALLDAVGDLADTELHPLYDRYPDYSIDAAAEQRRLRAAHSIVWQHPTYWYGVPSLLALWFEAVLVRGFAHGVGGEALRGKPLLWATTTGNLADQHDRGELDGLPLDGFAPQVKFTAQYCGLDWQPPFVVHRAHRLAPAELARAAREYRERVAALAGRGR